MTADMLQRWLQPLVARVRALCGIGKLDSVDDSGGVQVVQVQLLGDAVRQMPHYQPFGFTSRAPAGAQVVWGALNGNPNNMVALLVDATRTRKRDLLEGESALYHPDGGYVHLANGGVLALLFATRVTVDTPEIVATGLVNVGGVYQVAGTQVVGAQGAAVADPAGGSVVDVQARAALADLLARVRAHGLIAT